MFFLSAGSVWTAIRLQEPLKAHGQTQPVPRMVGMKTAQLLKAGNAVCQISVVFINTQLQLKDAGEVAGVGYVCPLSIKHSKSAKAYMKLVGVSNLLYLPVSHRHLEPLLFCPGDSSIVRSLPAHLFSLTCFQQVWERGRIHTHPEQPVIDRTHKSAYESDNSSER